MSLTIELVGIQILRWEVDLVSERVLLQYDVVDGMMSVQDALKAMKYKNNKSLIVEKRDEYDEYGMVLISDVATKVLAVDKSPKRVNIYEVMTKPILTVDPEMDIRYAARLFDRYDLPGHQWWKMAR